MVWLLIYKLSNLCDLEDESQAGIKIARRKINNFRYADFSFSFRCVYNTILMAESEEEMKNHLMRVKEESEKLA